MTKMSATKTKRKTDFLTHFLYSAIAGLLIGIAALALFLIQERQQAADPADNGPFKLAGEANYDGAIAIEPPLEMPDFTLINQHGEKTSLSDLRGRHLLLTFGFTHCPDICPLTLNDFRRIQEMLGDRADKVHFVFISVDGERDSPQALGHYFSFRQLDKMIALTGEEQAVRELGKPYGLSFEISEEEGASGYLINHTTGSFLLDPEGRWVMRYQFGVPPSTIVEDLRGRLAA